MLRALVRVLDRVLLLLPQAYATMRVEALEGQMLQRLKMAQAEEPVTDAGHDLRAPTGANGQPAEIRVADREVFAEISRSVAERAVGIAQQLIPRVRGRRIRLSRPRNSAGEPSQCLLDLLGHPSPRLAIP